MIIIEGPDNAGKSTLGETLSKELGWGLVHSPNHKDMLGDQQKWFEWIRDSLVSQEDKILYDRHPLISEQVYGPILRKKNVFAEEPGASLFKVLLGSAPLIIYCRPPMDHIMQFGDREQLEGVKDNALMMIREYDGLMADIHENPTFNGTIVDYDYTRTSVGSILLAIGSHLDAWPETVPER